MKKTFVMRGQTASGLTEVLEFGGKQKETKGMAYRMTEFTIYPSATHIYAELSATVTANKTAEDPSNPNYDNDGLIATAMLSQSTDSQQQGPTMHVVVNDTYLITQNLILKVIDTYTGSPMAVNWQCRFEAVKMSNAEEAATNYKQFAIFDE